MIPLPQIYKEAVQDKHNNINQIIRIGNVYIGRTRTYLKDTLNTHPIYYEDRDLKISTIKQSVDFNSKAFKIASVSVSVSNYSIGGNRFSDLFVSQSLSNKPVTIYYVPRLNTSRQHAHISDPAGIDWGPDQQVICTIGGGYEVQTNLATCEGANGTWVPIITEEQQEYLDSLVPGFETDIEPTEYLQIGDCLKVFEGKIRRFDISEEKASFTIEDVTQEKLHKDLPLARLPDTDVILEEYRGRVVPMVFGYNDKSPLVYYREDVLDNKFYWIPDNIFSPEGSNVLGGVVSRIGGIKSSDLEGKDKPIRAWKEDWIEVDSRRRTFQESIDQYTIVDNNYISMEKDTASLEALQIKADEEGLAQDEFLVSSLLELSPITNNIFEGIVHRKASNCILHDEFLPASENNLFDYNIHYKGATGGGTDEIVELESLDMENIEFTFPKLGDGDEILYGDLRGFSVKALHLQTEEENANPTTGSSANDNYDCMSGSGSYDTWNWASSSKWITIMPTPEQLFYFIDVWAPANGFSHDAIDFVDGGYTDYPSEDWQWGHYYSDCTNSWGRSGGIGRIVRYRDTSLYPDVDLSLENNTVFNKWWLGETQSGTLGGDFDSGGWVGGIGHAPILKNWTEEELYAYSTFYYSYYHGNMNPNPLIRGDLYTAIVSASEWYRLENFIPTINQQGVWPAGVPGGIAYFDPTTGCFNTGGHSQNHIGDLEGNAMDVCVRHACVGSYGYVSYESADLVTLLKQGDTFEGVKIGFNFTDIKDTDILRPIIIDDVVRVNPYKPQFAVKGINVNGAMISSQNDTRLAVAIDHFEPYLDIDLPNSQGDEFNFVGEAESSYALYNYFPTVTNDKWTSPNDFNDIGITFKIGNEEASNTHECEIQGYVKEPSLTHYTNYTQLDKTNFYARVMGRQGWWRLHEELESNFEYVFPVAEDKWHKFQLKDSEYWNIYTRYSGVMSLTWRDIWDYTGGDDFVDPKTDYYTSFNMWDLVYSCFIDVGTEGGFEKAFDGYPEDAGIVGWFSIQQGIDAMHSAALETDEDGNLSGDPIQVIKDMFQAYWDGLFEAFGDEMNVAEIIVYHTVAYITWHIRNLFLNSPSLVENPADVICSLLLTDLNFQGSFNSESLLEAMKAHPEWKMAFTVSEKINSKTLIEGIASNTRLFPKLRPNDGSLSFVFLRPDYLPEHVTQVVDVSDIIKYKFNKTKMDDVKNKIRVLYKLDPERGEYDKITPYVYSAEKMPDYSSDYYGLESETEDTTLEFEADYIRDEYTALQLRDFLCMYHSNQKVEIKADISPIYSHLETGDVICLSELINDFKAYGTDYSGYSYINGQIVLPYFIIKQVTIREYVTIVAEQLHYTGQNQPDFETYLAGLDFDEEDIAGMIDSADDEGEGDIPLNQPVMGCTYGDAENYDPLAQVDDGSCEFIIGSGFEPGDINGDGSIDVLDVVVLINIILGNSLATGGGGESSNWIRLSENKFKKEVKYIRHAELNSTVPSFTQNISFNDMHTRILKSYVRKL